ncbi:MAG: hypothetical protein HC841_00995 [Verrucomicrobiae bacterium]|nr:hypothetical protein [Verrucomicrobiae bacterium]
MAAFFSTLGRLLGGDVPQDYKVADVYSGMREMILTISPEKLPILKDKPIYAVLVEMGRPGAAVTMMTVADGAASLYFSNGGGIIGLGEHENVRKESLEFIRLSSQFLPQMKKVSIYPLPKPDQTQFYIITPDGIYTHFAQDSDIEKQSHPLFPLWSKAQDVITQMRITDERRKAEQGH